LKERAAAAAASAASEAAEEADADTRVVSGPRRMHYASRTP